MKIINCNIKYMMQKKGIPFALVTTMLATGIIACSKKADCEIPETHAHLYTDENGYKVYKQRENFEYKGFVRGNEYISLTEEEKELYKFLEKNELLRIEDNIDLILAEQEKNSDYVQYQYSYTSLFPMATGKTVTLIPMQKKDWTTDPNHDSLTGETRNCHHVYQAVNIYKDENGKYVIVPSELVDDIREVMNDYTYIKKDYHKIIDMGTKEEIEVGKTEKELTITMG